MTIRLTKSTKIVLARLTTDGPMTPKQLGQSVGLAPRTVTLALKKLVEESLCQRVSNLEDMRQPIYRVNMKRVKELQLLFTIDTYARLHPAINPSDHTSRFQR